MKPRERPTQVTLAVPPPELRMFCDLSKADGRGPGMDAYPDRAAWLAARREWEAAHGMTLKQWEDALIAQLHAEDCTLSQLNDAARFMIEDDDFTDPRLDPWMM